jgi:hypothetical protein
MMVYSRDLPEAQGAPGGRFFLGLCAGLFARLMMIFELGR